MVNYYKSMAKLVIEESAHHTAFYEAYNEEMKDTSQCMITSKKRDEILPSLQYHNHGKGKSISKLKKSFSPLTIN